MDLAMSARVGETQSVARVRGELDLGTAGLLSDQLSLLLGAGSPRLVVDVGGVSFLDCAGLRVLLRARTACVARGGWLRLTAVPPSVRCVLKLTGTQELAAPLRLASRPSLN